MNNSRTRVIRLTVAAMRRIWRVTLALAALVVVLMGEGVELLGAGVQWLRLKHTAGRIGTGHHV